MGVCRKVQKQAQLYQESVRDQVCKKGKKERENKCVWEVECA